MNQIRILIADDHAIVRSGLRAILNQKVDLSVVGEAATVEEAIAQSLLLHPDIVVMDIQMPSTSGIDACRKIIEQLPATRVIMLTAFAEDALLFAAIKAGASGYVLKRIGTDDLVRTIEAVAHGQSAIDPTLTEVMFKRISDMENAKESTAFCDLSTQELRVLALITEGSSNREIAGRLFLAEGTVRNYVSTMFSKLLVANRAEAAAFAIHHKLHDHLIPQSQAILWKKIVNMANSILEIYRKAVFDAGITGRDWRKTEAYDEFTRHYTETYTEVQRQFMKYDDILKISKAWWEMEHGKYS
jgi:two-component system, NarL family, response regulator DevR